MSSDKEPSKIGGDAKYYQGVVQESVGKALGNEQMQTDGTAKKLEGQSEAEAAKVAGQQKKEKVIGNVKETTGSALGNEQMEAEGRERKQNA
ncbi:8392_t:CDS:2 [Cetraspora pellucida]|uniref:8392_t:CDS:1 n=1 Tax=Cetraspora pellucida TaxID=1433469 RepID=A0A9N8W0F3_9GLOM|nr:8392_t:CDS:2 [Cetraspora pellucida]